MFLLLFVFSLSRGRTYIDRSFILSVWVWVGAAPISIGHLLVMSVCVSGTAPISIGHHLVSSSFRGRTYINRPCSYHFSCSVWARTAPISIGHCFVRLSWVLFNFESPSFFSFGVQSHRRAYSSKHFESSCFPSFWAFRVVLSTWLLGSYRLFIITLLEFPLPLHMT